LRNTVLFYGINTYASIVEKRVEWQTSYAYTLQTCQTVCRTIRIGLHTNTIAKSISALAVGAYNMIRIAWLYIANGAARATVQT